MKLSEPDRRSLAEKLMELGNLSVAGLFLAQVVPTGQKPSWALAGAGVGMLLSLYLVAMAVLKGGGRQ
jgi:hypothetical protein